MSTDFAELNSKLDQVLGSRGFQGEVLSARGDESDKQYSSWRRLAGWKEDAVEVSFNPINNTIAITLSVWLRAAEGTLVPFERLNVAKQVTGRNDVSALRMSGSGIVNLLKGGHTVDELVDRTNTLLGWFDDPYGDLAGFRSRAEAGDRNGISVVGAREVLDRLK
jgi:hypothetical protein